MKALVSAALVAIGLTSLGAAPPPSTLRGFSAQSSARERTIDSQFADIPSVQSALDDARAIAARTHYAGTPGDYALAVFMRDRLRAAGLAAQLEPFKAQVDTPRELVVEFTPSNGEPARRGRRHRSLVALDLAERGQPDDPPTNDRSIGLPFNAGSADGDIRAPLVYANWGRETDYATLAQARLDVRGSIVLVRSGAESRSLPAQRAQQHGAAGVIFYSDPSDDGFVRGPDVPDGPWRPSTAVERSSVGSNITIPTLPVSADNAQILLASLRGPAAPPSWTGGLPVAYPLARGTDSVHLIVKLNHKTTTLWNTVAIVPGLQADQQVIVGAQRDAWVYGVGDGAGITTLLELARGLGFLLRGGWHPGRSIVLAGWDGNDIAAAGSQAYQSRHQTALERGCIAYINADRSVTGARVHIDSAAAIAPLIVAAARSVRDPSTPSATIYDRWLAAAARAALPNDDFAGTSDRAAPFRNAGIPVAAIRFEGPFGVRNSAYDTLHYAQHFSDPGFGFHRAAAQLYGLVALHLADADAVPYTFGGYADLVHSTIERIAVRSDRVQVGGGIRLLAAAANRLARAAGRIDARIGAADAGLAAREVQAVRLLNGRSGNPGTSDVFPALEAALTADNSAALGPAIDRAAQTLRQVTALLDGE